MKFGENKMRFCPQNLENYGLILISNAIYEIK